MERIKMQVEVTHPTESGRTTTYSLGEKSKYGTTLLTMRRNGSIREIRVNTIPTSQDGKRLQSYGPPFLIQDHERGSEKYNELNALMRDD